METDLKKEIKLEEKEENGDTPTPSQENSDFSDNSDLSVEELEKELDAMDNDSKPDNNSLPQNENVPNNVESEHPFPMPNGKLDEIQPDTENVSGNAQEKLLTQSQVNELVGKARKEGRESALKDLLVRYGVNDENELNDMFGRGQAYDDLDYDYQNQGKSYKDAMAENALLKSHIDEGRWEDVKSILGYKGLEVNVENISALLPTHQEWLGNNGSFNSGMPQDRQVLTEDMAEQMLDNQYQNAANQVGLKKPGMLKKLGNEPAPVKEKSEEELAAELYGWNK